MILIYCIRIIRTTHISIVTFICENNLHLNLRSSIKPAERKFHLAIIINHINMNYNKKSQYIYIDICNHKKKT